MINYKILNVLTICYNLFKLGISDLNYEFSEKIFIGF